MKKGDDKPTLYPVFDRQGGQSEDRRRNSVELPRSFWSAPTGQIVARLGEKVIDAGLADDRGDLSGCGSSSGNCVRSHRFGAWPPASKSCSAMAPPSSTRVPANAHFLPRKTLPGLLVGRPIRCVRSMGSHRWKYPAANCVALVGRSGSHGKSTLLNLAGAMDFPTSGQVLLDGVPTSSLKDAELTQLRRAKAGFIFQSFQLLNTLTVFENAGAAIATACGKTPMRARPHANGSHGSSWRVS